MREEVTRQTAFSIQSLRVRAWRGPGNNAAKWPDSGGGGQRAPGGGGLGAQPVKGIPCWVVSALF